jgi:hypothetical protein
MTDGHYKDSLDAAKTEMEELLTEQTSTEQRLQYIASRLEVLRKTVLSLGELLGEQYEPEAIGITKAIRNVMREMQDDRGSYISPITVRNALQKGGFPLGEYKNALAVIHTTLKRLDDQGEVESHTWNSGRTSYRWNKARDGEITDDDIPF